MRAERNQTTLAAPCTVSGRGYWTGAQNSLTFLPAPADSGIRFVRADLLGHPSVLVAVENRNSMPLRTCLSRGRAEVDMVEHVLAALHGLQIDNAIVHCTACEMPAMDGSAFAFTLALQAVGRVELQAARPTLILDRTIRVGDDRQWIVAEPLPSPWASSGLVPYPAQRCELEYRLDFGPDSPIAKANHAIRLEPKVFFETICAARTFIGIETAQMLQARGMAQHVTQQDLIVFGPRGPINNRLRYPDECARHKLLDLIGDLAVTGVDMVGRITSHRGGHQLNGEMSTALRELFAQQNSQNNTQNYIQSPRTTALAA